jgi:hypothetical protein
VRCQHEYRLSTGANALIYPERDVEHVRDPHAADRKPILGRDAHRVALVVERDRGRIVDLHDRVSCRIDKGEPFGRCLGRCHKAVQHVSVVSFKHALGRGKRGGRGALSRAPRIAVRT